MVDKKRILDALDDFKDEYGVSFSSAYAEETDIIEDALDLYYEKLKEESKNNEQTLDYADQNVMMSAT